MSKKVFILSTTTCGYCRQAKAMVNAKYPGLTKEQFTYFEYDKGNLDTEASMVLNTAKKLGVRGVPFTVFIENGQVTDAVRGYDPAGITTLVERVLAGPQEGDQLELELEAGV